MLPPATRQVAQPIGTSEAEWKAPRSPANKRPGLDRREQGKQHAARMGNQIISTEKAPKAIGPYSQAVVSGDLIFTSGQIPLDPATQQMVQGDVRAQAERVMENLGAVLAAAGSGFEKVIKATIFLADLNDFAVVNEVYGKRFPRDPPARSTVQVAALPKGARVEIELIARKG